VKAEQNEGVQKGKKTAPLQRDRKKGNRFIQAEGEQVRWQNQGQQGGGINIGCGGLKKTTQPKNNTKTKQQTQKKGVGFLVGR